MTVRTGPLGLQITPLPDSEETFVFRGARIRGQRCVFSAGDVCSAELQRSAREQDVAADNTVQVLIRIPATGSVMDSDAHFDGAIMRVIRAGCDVCEDFEEHSHIATLYIQQAVLGIDHETLEAMTEYTYLVTPMQSGLLRSAVALLSASEGAELVRNVPAVDRYLAALAGLLLRTAVLAPAEEPERLSTVRTQTEALIHLHASDPHCTPASLAAELCISLRQLYRAFDGKESPASQIRRRRLEIAADLLGSHQMLSVDKIALQCGFVSAEYFSRAFRRQYGVSPRAYRTAHRDVVESNGHSTRELVMSSRSHH